MSALVACGVVVPQPSDAQAACAAETEPNQPETDAPIATGAFCLTGELPSNDQDFLLWDRIGSPPGLTWTMALTGAAGVLTRLGAYEVASQPGAPLLAGRRLIELRFEPDAIEPATATDLLLPERVLIGLGRSDLADGGVPTDTAYTLEAVVGAALPVAGDAEPNDVPEDATRVEGAFELSGDVAGSVDVFAWTVPDPQPPDGWRLDARGVAGAGVGLTLRDGTGRTLASANADDQGVASLRDLRLPPGSVEVMVSGGPPEGPSPYAIAARAEEGPGDAEPNGEPDRAQTLIAGEPTSGRITGHTDVDLFRVPAQGAAEQRLLDVRLIWRTDASRELCLATLERQFLQCRRSSEGIVLKDLLLPDDRFLLSVSGPPDPDDRYVLRVDTTSVPSPEWETEPNEGPEIANALPASLSIEGSGAAEDVDVFALTATGEPQLWRLDVQGSAIDRVEWVRADGSTMGSAEVTSDGTSARLFDLYFVPGQRQLLRVRATDGDYRLALEPLGPPDPNGEREPNDGLAFNESLLIGQPRTGRLATTADADEYRFTTTATDHLVLELEAPADGDLDVRLYDDAALSVAHVIQPGTTRDLDLLLRTGDYRLVMSSDHPGEGRYSLRLDRADPYLLALDQEPNDSPGWASPLMGNGRVVGTAPPEGNYDWYRLPTLDSPTSITITTEDGVRMIDVLTDAQTEVPLETDVGGTTYRTGPLTAGVDHYIRVLAEGDHAFSVEGLPDAGPEPPTSTVTVEPQVQDTAVAAFWPDAQRLTGTVRLASAGGAGSSWQLDATTSDARWDVVVDDAQPTVEPDGTVEVPFEITVPPNVAADVPVRVTFRARSDDGGLGTASLDLVPLRDAVALGPHRSWSVPAALLGGLDVASPWLGATLMPSVDPVGEAALHDGFAPTDGGLAWPIAGLPLVLTVDLAGDDPVPVGGIILNALSGDPTFGDSPARFELELSLDGGTWSKALSGMLERSVRDQAFVLDEPLEARFARLVIRSTHREGAGRISLGEWKVVAVPGRPSPVEPIDLAEPFLGGHVAWAVPQLGRIELAQAMIDEDPAMLEQVPAEPKVPLTWAIGFFEGRAALITSMEWSDPQASDPDVRFDRLEVDVSVEGPLGPWSTLGTWHLERGPGGGVAPFVLDAPTWARFVRFTTEPTRKDARVIELPGAMRIYEAPTAEGYRSILGQWGLGEPAGPFEVSAEPRTAIADDANDDARERPRDLALKAEASGRVHQGEDVDWFSVSIPGGQRTLRAVVGGEPFVGVELLLHEPDGAEIPMTYEPGELPGTVLYQAPVEPGAEYVLEVRQPASSVVVTFDTSVSVGPYLDSILGALRGFGADVVTGRETVRILPFDGEPLLPGWNDQPFEIQAAASTYVLRESSSGAEENLGRAARDLAPRRGARAVLIITDAASSSYRSTADLWDELGAVRPLVFAVQTGGLNEAHAWQRHHLMTDWAASAGGVYRYAHSRADIENAFDHMASWLRRPAGYRLTVDTSPDELPPPEPGRLSVAAPEDPSGRPQVVLAGDVAVELILDTSGSMLESIGGERRIDVAKRVLVELVGQDLPPGIPVALRVFEDRAVCATELAVPLGSLDPPSMIATILDRKVPRRAPTPLAAALEQVSDDLASATGRRVVVVLSDGRESCDGDPEEAVRSLMETGVDVRLNIVGFGLESRRDRRAMAELAELGHGSYFDARRGEDLAAAMAAAISAPYRVIDAGGAVVAEGTIGGAPVSVASGTYVIEVATTPEVRYDEVYVAPGGTVELTLPTAEGPEPIPP